MAPGENGIRHIYVSRGSRYHSGSGAGDEEFFAAMVHARRGPDGRHTRPWTHLVIEDTLFDVAHHQSVTIRYRSMPLERESGFFLERCGRMQQGVPERVVIVRSHTHGSYRNYTECGFTAVSTPAWKLQDAFAAMGRYLTAGCPHASAAWGSACRAPMLRRYPTSTNIQRPPVRKCYEQANASSRWTS
jgi:hypothetical protein